MPDRLPARRQNAGGPLTAAEKRRLIARMRALGGPSRSFVAEIARQALRARGRLDDDVYGIVRVTLEALTHNGGAPPPLIFAVTHWRTGQVEQVGFLPPGTTRLLRGGRFATNDPRFRFRALPPGAGRIEE